MLQKRNRIHMLKAIILVGIGGSIGSVLRFLITLLIQKYFTSNFPWPTLLVNIIGCLLMGLIYKEYVLQQNENLRYLLMIGFCGGFTTFSAFALENVQLMQQQQWPLSLLYMALSIVLSFLGFVLGTLIN
jgi:CrcB protein